MTNASTTTPRQQPDGPRVLTADELMRVAGGDNPGMGSYDGKGDQSLPSHCEWLDYGGRVRCTYR